MARPSKSEILHALRLGPPQVRRLTKAFYDAKASEYRATLTELLNRYGIDRRVVLSAEIRKALHDEAERDARSVVTTYNRLIQAEADRSKLEGQELFDHMAAYARERGRARADFIANAEVATARLDASVAFFRENGIEPKFDFVGPAPKCEVCKALKQTGPHSIELVLKVGLPHIGCSHRWKARAYSAAKLRAAGLRPGKISAGRGGVAGIVGSVAMVTHFGSDARAAGEVRRLAARLD